MAPKNFACWAFEEDVERLASEQLFGARTSSDVSAAMGELTAFAEEELQRILEAEEKSRIACRGIEVPPLHSADPLRRLPNPLPWTTHHRVFRLPITRRQWHSRRTVLHHCIQILIEQPLQTCPITVLRKHTRSPKHRHQQAQRALQEAHSARRRRDRQLHRGP